MRTTKFHRPGFSLMESMMLVVILGIVGAGVGQCLSAVAKPPKRNETEFQIALALVNQMETLRDLDFNDPAMQPGTTTSTGHHQQHALHLHDHHRFGRSQRRQQSHCQFKTDSSATGRQFGLNSGE